MAQTTGRDLHGNPRHKVRLSVPHMEAIQSLIRDDDLEDDDLEARELLLQEVHAIIKKAATEARRADRGATIHALPIRKQG
jgi:hypothetical protein